MSVDDDLERARARRRLYALLDELEIIGSVRAEMIAAPERAVPVLERARGPGVRNPAALAIARWRQLGAARPATAAAEPEVESGPPDLAALEQAWSMPPSIVGELILNLMAVAIARHGGYTALRDSFHRRRTGLA